MLLAQKAPHQRHLSEGQKAFAADWDDVHANWHVVLVKLFRQELKVKNLIGVQIRQNGPKAVAVLELQLCHPYDQWLSRQRLENLHFISA